MKKSTIQLSRESERQVIIQELNLLGVYETLKGESLETLSYHSLRSVLALEEAVRS